ncbi:Rho termination factor N-terminal domain-containing protein [Gimesia sp.]|uniref:Rho termination factor N-terminal domain-containing protein n=1 Tax=Gimesia sp. TaxID=2024833 RepID=UPI003A8DBCF6
MPTSWTDKDEKQYQHIRRSELDRGKPEDKAEEIAARTVNKQRRQAGKTPNKTTQGTGNPHTRLEDRTVDELQNLASENNIKGRSKMKKTELIKALRDKR